MKTSRVIIASVVGTAIFATALILGPRSITLAEQQHGDSELASLLAEHAPAGSQHISAFQLREGELTLAGLGAEPDTEFEIGSITKTFTAQLLHQAINAGELSPDTRVSEIIATGESPIGEVTLRELADHTSGLPRLAGVGLWDNVRYLAWGADPYEGITAEDIFTLTTEAELSRAGEMEYSNFGVSLLGHLLAHHAGTSYGDLLQDRLLTPLDMDHTTLDAGEGSPLGRDSRGRTMAAWDSEGYAPAGGLRSTAADMALFSQHLLDESIPDFTWVHEGPNIRWHNGGTGGFTSMLVLDREKNSAAFVVTDTTAGVEDLALTLLEETR